MAHGWSVASAAFPTTEIKIGSQRQRPNQHGHLPSSVVRETHPGACESRPRGLSEALGGHHFIRINIFSLLCSTVVMFDTSAMTEDELRRISDAECGL